MVILEPNGTIDRHTAPPQGWRYTLRRWLTGLLTILI